MLTSLMLAHQWLTQAATADHKAQHCHASLAAELNTLEIEKREGQTIPALNIPFRLIHPH